MRFGTDRLVRLVRERRLDGNPLRRGSDRVETVVLGALLAAFLAVAPIVAHVVGSWTYASSTRKARAQRVMLHAVPATMLRTPARASSYPGVDYDPLGVTVRWWAPGGQMRTGDLLPSYRVSADGTVTVWVDRAGRLANPPLERFERARRAHVAEGLCVGALALVLIVACRLVRRALDRRRMAAWDADWLATGPRWRLQR